MFRELCGEDALQNDILTTTMWDEVTDDVVLSREDQLRKEFWKLMMSCGCRMARFRSTYESAWDTINWFDFDTRPRRPVVQLQTEMVDEGKELSQTAAHAVLLRRWEKHVAKLKRLRKREAQPSRFNNHEAAAADRAQLNQ